MTSGWSATVCTLLVEKSVCLPRTSVLTCICAAAKNQAAGNPERTIFDIKRLIGRKFSEKDVQNEYVFMSLPT